VILVAGIVLWIIVLIAGLAVAPHAHADPDTDYANQLHGYGIYGPKDYNTWIGKNVWKRLYSGVDAAVNMYCPDERPSCSGPLSEGERHLSARRAGSAGDVRNRLRHSLYRQRRRQWGLPDPRSDSRNHCTAEQIMAAARDVGPVYYERCLIDYNNHSPQIQPATQGQMHWFFSMDSTNRRAYSEEIATNFADPLTVAWPNHQELLFNNEGVAAHTTDICTQYPPAD